MLEELPKAQLRLVVKSLPKYEGRRKGDGLSAKIVEHLDSLSEKKSDLVQEEEMIKGIYDKWQEGEKA